VRTENTELRGELNKLLEQYKAHEKSFNSNIESKTVELSKIQDEIKVKIDTKLTRLMTNFNKEKDKYEKLKKQEDDLSEQYSKLKKKYEGFKT